MICWSDFFYWYREKKSNDDSYGGKMGINISTGCPKFSLYFMTIAGLILIYVLIIHPASADYTCTASECGDSYGGTWDGCYYGPGVFQSPTDVSGDDSFDQDGSGTVSCVLNTPTSTPTATPTPTSTPTAAPTTSTLTATPTSTQIATATATPTPTPTTIPTTVATTVPTATATTVVTLTANPIAVLTPDTGASGNFDGYMFTCPGDINNDQWTASQEVSEVISDLGSDMTIGCYNNVCGVPAYIESYGCTYDGYVTPTPTPVPTIPQNEGTPIGGDSLWKYDETSGFYMKIGPNDADVAIGTSSIGATLLGGPLADAGIITAGSENYVGGALGAAVLTGGTEMKNSEGGYDIFIPPTSVSLLPQFASDPTISIPIYVGNKEIVL